MIVIIYITMADNSKVITTGAPSAAGATGGPADQKLDDLIKKVKENTDYKSSIKGGIRKFIGKGYT